MKAGQTIAVSTVRQKRGIFGKLWILLFWLWNAFCAYALIAGVANVSQRYSGLTTDAERAGAVVGTGLGVGFMLSIWVIGVVILGAMAMLTRGKQVIVTKAPAGP